MSKLVGHCALWSIVVHLLMNIVRMPLERHSLSTNKILLDLALLEDKKQQFACVTPPLRSSSRAKTSVRLDIPFRWMNFAVSGARHCGTQVRTLEIHRNHMSPVPPFGCAWDNPNGFRWIQMDTWCGQAWRTFERTKHRAVLWRDKHLGHHILYTIRVSRGHCFGESRSWETPGGV